MAELRVCPRCRTINPPSARNCSNCGAVLLGTGGGVSLGMELPEADPATGQTSEPANQSSIRPPANRNKSPKQAAVAAAATPSKAGCGCLVVSLALAVIAAAGGIFLVQSAADKGPKFVQELAGRIVGQFQEPDAPAKPNGTDPSGVANLPPEARNALAQAAALQAEAQKAIIAAEEQRRRAEAEANKVEKASDREGENGFLGGQKGADGISKSAIARVIDRGRSRAKVCYIKQLAKNPQLHGIVKVAFVVLPNGTVGEAKVLQPLADADELSECLLRLVNSWQFPAAANGGETRVTFPFSFKK